jgi:hypothetical protein
MPTVNFASEHMDVDVQVNRTKRKVKTAPVRPKDEKLKILESTKRKPHKARAIQRARNLKYADDGRGEEAEVSMHKENLNNELSSRKAQRFAVIFSHKTFGFKSTKNAQGRWCVDQIDVVERRIAAKGVVYTGHRKCDEKVIMVHESNGLPHHHWAHPTLLDRLDTFFSIGGRYFRPEHWSVEYY